MTTPSPADLAVGRALWKQLAEHFYAGDESECVRRLDDALAAARAEGAPSLYTMPLEQLRALASRANAALAHRVLGDPMQSVTIRTAPGGDDER